MGDSPCLSFSIFSGTISTHVTLLPRSAKQAAVTRPTYPTPMTVIRRIILLQKLYNFFRAQAFDFRFTLSQLTQNFVGVLSEQWRMAAISYRRCAEMNRIPNRFRHANQGMLDFDNHAARPRLWI